MRTIIFRFKRLIRFIVAIFVSREFAFIYCLVGTCAQLAHTYFLTESISALSGGWKHLQAFLLSFFISSSLLFFTAIADNSDTKDGKRIRFAVNGFMFIEILINLYYYVRHLILDTEQIMMFDFIFATLVSCFIPVTIKLYATTIRAKDWITELETPTSTEIKPNILSEEQVLEIVKYSIDEYMENYKPVNIEEQTSIDINSTIKQEFENYIKGIDEKVSKIFETKQSLFLNQFENKFKFYVNELNKTYKSNQNVTEQKETE